MGVPAQTPSERPVGYLDITTALAMELASQLTPASDVFKRHHIKPEDAKKLLSDETFRRMVRDARSEWAADKNIADRIKLKAQMALEELLLPTFAMATDPKIPPASRHDATKLFERLSGIGKGEGGDGNMGPRFVLSINVGGDKPREIEGQIIEQED